MMSSSWLQPRHGGWTMIAHGVTCLSTLFPHKGNVVPAENYVNRKIFSSSATLSTPSLAYSPTPQTIRSACRAHRPLSCQEEDRTVQLTSQPTHQSHWSQRADPSRAQGLQSTRPHAGAHVRQGHEHGQRLPLLQCTQLTSTMCFQTLKALEVLIRRCPTGQPQPHQ